MKTDRNGRILCNCGRVMVTHSPLQEGVGPVPIIRLSCQTHGVRHTLKVVEELPA